MSLHSAVVLLAAFLLATSVLVTQGSVTCYTEPSVAGEFNCRASTNNFYTTIEGCCLGHYGHFFQGVGDASCQACIVFGFLNGTEIVLPEQGEATILAIGFIKGGNVQSLTGIDRRNTARFAITITGSATEGPNADFTIQLTSFEIKGPDARAPFNLTTFVRLDRVTLEPAENFILTLEGCNAAGSAIIDPALPGQFVSPTIHVVIDDVENAKLQFTASDCFSNLEGELFIAPVVQLLTAIATDLTVRIVPINISEVIDRNLLPALPPIPAFDPRVPNIATSAADFSTTPAEITFVAGGATTIRLDPGIEIVDDEINEVEQLFALILEVVDAIDPSRVDLQSGRYASLARIFDDDSINIGFEQERYTVFEATDATGQLIPISIIKQKGQKSELTFEVIATLTLGSGPTAAQPGEDFEANPPVRKQPFQPDEQEIDYRYELLDDTPENPDVPEPPETFQIQLSLADEGFTNINLAASGGSLFATATVVIIDDDDMIIGWEQNVTRVNESQSILELCVRVLNLADSVEFPEGFEVSLAANTIRGTAADPGDYTALVADNDLFFAIIDDYTRRTCIEVEIIDDTLLEITEFLSIEVVPDPFVVDNGNIPSNIRLDPALTFVEIQDNDNVRIGFNQIEYGPVLEGTDNVAVVYVAVLEGDLQRSVSVTFSTTVLGSDTATGGTDFEPLTRELTFDMNTKIIPVEITIINDNFFEEIMEVFTVGLTRDPDDLFDEVIIDPEVAAVTILDDEIVVIGYAPVLYTVEEDESGVDVTIGLIEGDLTGLIFSTAILVRVSAASFTATAGDDFNFTPRTLRFTELNTEFTLRPSISDDDVTEGPEVFFMLAQSNDIRVQIRPDQANVTIIDDDPTVIGFVNAPVSVVESAGPAILQVAFISGSLEREVFVDFITQDGTAVAPGDYTTTTQRLTFGPSSVVDVPSNVPVDITSDDLLEDDETFGASLTLVNTPLIVAVVPDVATVTIEDDDEAQIGFVPDSYTVNEEDGSVTLTVRVISGSFAREIEVGFMTENDEALAGEDYSAISETLTFSSTVIERTVTVPILSDNFFEFRERFFGNLMLLSTGVNVIVSPSRADVFIDDDDAMATIGWEKGFTWVNEGDGVLEICVCTLNVIGNPFPPDISITLAANTIPVTAADPGDYVQLSEGNSALFLTDITATNSRACIEVSINDDTQPERIEVFTVQVVHPTGLPVNFFLEPDQTVVAIIDND